VRAAFSNRCGTATYFETDHILSAGYGRSDHRPSQRFRCDEQVVDVITVDEFIARHVTPHVAMVKLDVEGQERAAIESMKELLARKAPIVLTEVTTTTAEGVRDLLSYGKVLTESGLRCYRPIRQLSPVSYQDIPKASISICCGFPR
jgi:hypothetical protein